MRLNDSFADRVVLALLVEEPRHGFAIARILATDEHLAQTVNISRPIVYRSLNTLLERGLIGEVRTEPGAHGSDRTVYRPTARGIRETNEWLDEPVDLPRDARIDLLTKFILRSRRGLSNRNLARRQIARFAPLARRLDTDSEPSDVVALWRSESLDATLRVLRRIADAAPAPQRPAHTR
jgi:DNA-binding PadR family transcriptional regulator